MMIACSAQRRLDRERKVLELQHNREMTGLGLR